MEGGVCTLSLNYAPDLGTGKGPGEVSGLNAQFVCSFVLGKGKDQDGEGAELIVLFSYPVLSKELLDRNGTDSPKKGVGLNAVGPISSPQREPPRTGLIYSRIRVLSLYKHHVLPQYTGRAHTRTHSRLSFSVCWQEF